MTAGQAGQGYQFARALAVAINLMLDDDARGSVVALTRQDGLLVSVTLDLVQLHALNERTAASYEALVFDGGNRFGDAWKHVFLPRERAELFVRDGAEANLAQL